MINTYTSYQLITRDLGKSIDRVSSQPMVQREADYFRENIGKVTSIDELLDDYRLYNFAMKAYGLQDMAYAKAFMRKALEEGVSDPNSFANRLNDKRYAQFVRAFNFELHEDKAVTYSPAVQGVVNRFTLEAIKGAIPQENIDRETANYRERIGEIRSPKELVADDRLLSYVLYAFELEEHFFDKDMIVRALESDPEDPQSAANTILDGKFKDLATAFDFAKRGPDATTFIEAIDGTMAKYMRQTLEEDAGKQNEGVRLALYFERMIGTIANPFQILGDRALATVVRTALGLPASIAQADIDRQASLISNRIDLEALKSDPEALSKFMSRFLTMWEIENPTTAPMTPTLQLFQPREFGISSDALMALAQLKR
jgi:hypothetical protein